MVSFLDLQMNHVKERFEDEKNKEVLFMCIGITSGVGRLLFGRIADYVPGLKKVYLQVLYTLLPCRRRLTGRSFTLSVPIDGGLLAGPLPSPSPIDGGS